MPKPADSSAGVAGFLVGEGESERKGLERPAAEGDSPVREAGLPAVEHPSRAGHVKPRPNPWGPSHKAEYRCRPIVDEYREGKVKRTPSRGVKETLKSCAPGLREPARVTACLLHNEPASCRAPARLRRCRSRSESECEQRAQLGAADPKPGDLSVGRLNPR